MDSSHNYYCANTTNMTSQLDELEKYLFSLGQEVSAVLKKCNSCTINLLIFCIIALCL